MNTTIKNYWYTLKKEYEEKHKEKIFTHYENSKSFVEKFKMYVEDRHKEISTSVDLVCALATIYQELRNEKKGIKLLEDFIKTYKDELSNKDQARIYTNLAFYHSGCKEEIKYLLEAEKLESPFFETYKGLGLYHFSKYQFEEDVESLEKSLIAFEKSLKSRNSYSMRFNYGACLFELKQYTEAKEIFESLLIEYPNRMRLLLSISYCEIYLGNKEKALEYLRQVKEGQDENYHLSTDDISDYQIYDAYYVLEEYELFLKEYENVVYTQFFNEISYYYYALFITKRYQKFDEVLEKDKKKIISNIEETKIDEDFEDEEEERMLYIKSYQEDLDKLIEIEHKIKNEKYKPMGKLELYPEFGCYLVDCIRHSF
ncbi:tetratricopeptide repeat protein [Gemelliphila palaticanis]|uniref:Tetratricopeptide repeat protein n=1 Tax=Gemelliphila palaticanis TaxID=81950 RepID=A0ABX2T2N1_9BACL|nr:tetratricopeptide repeat protein [Gemella palaticanis]MBF0715799.1 tetratricopeptide repeat protein [Gemella palaticanis]NYS47729.1 tetratricopeptide repeat protein [Gemella palaticanis]